MRYMFVRVVPNSLGYRRPTGGKLNGDAESHYAKLNGFGHEEWNFRTELASDGYVYGYHYYKPSEKTQSGPFTLYFVTYVSGSWNLVGAYVNARYIPVPPPIPDRNLQSKLADLKRLLPDLGAGWPKKSDAEAIDQLRTDATFNRWRVRTPDIVSYDPPIRIPPTLKLSKSPSTRQSSASEISEEDSLRLEALSGYALREMDDELSAQEKDEIPDVELEAIEGNPKLVAHFRRERNRRIVRAKKMEALTLHKKLVCAVCNFNFRTVYGIEYCEVHHLKPLRHAADEGMKTKLEDLAIVCANCHRMLHRGQKLRTIADLQAEVKSMKLHRKPPQST